MTESIWQLQRVQLTSANVTRLETTTLEIQRGITAVIGYSGAGKTSLLNLLAELEKPTLGRITRTFPKTTSKLPLYWVPQDGGLWPHWTVERHLTAVLPQDFSPNNGKPGDFVEKLLEQFDLMHRSQAFPNDLSLGERSRLSVARALAARPGILVMDEPLTHVDQVRRPGYWKIIRQHLQQNETSLVFSTHESETAVCESQWVICLTEGRVLHDGETMDLYQAPPSEEAARFLGQINWFTEVEARAWLNNTVSQRLALRPEAICLVPDEHAKTKILSFRFLGSHAETVIEDTTTSTQRTIIHRPSGSIHKDGEHVRIEIVS